MGKEVKDKADNGRIPSLRAKAEDKLAQANAAPATKSADEGLHRVVHELRVHQIELEMQNEELRNAQVVIEESRTKYADLFDFAPVGYITLDQKNIIQDINLTCSYMLGKERSYIIGKPFISYVNGADISAFMSHVKSSFDTGEKKTTELALTVKDGILPVQLVSLPVGTTWQGAGLRMAIMDISARKKAEQELEKYRAGLEKLVEDRTVELKNEVAKHRQTEKKLTDWENNFERIMDISPDGILIVSDDGRLYANRRLTELLEYAPNELAGLLLEDLMPDESKDVVAARIKEIANGKEASYICDTVFISKNKRLVPVELVSASINWHRRSAGFVMIRDVAIRKRLEDETLKTQKLESIALLAGGIAHDFNNMLTGILGSINMAAHETGKASKAHLWLKEAEKASLRAADLTKQLLTFSKGGAPIKDVFSLNELLVESVSFALSGSNVKAEFFIPDTLLNIEADIGQINQVIHNIVINAKQAIPDGGVIRVGAEDRIIGQGSMLPLSEGKYVMFYIEDNGSGINEQNLAMIFDPYFTTKADGSGLGLASAYSIIKRHGGYIGVSPLATGGTRFEVYLQASDKAVTVSHAPSEGIENGSGRILVMDDDNVIRCLAAEILKKAGYEVECAKDGLEAINMYKNAEASGRPFDLLIMDLTVQGGMGGKQVVSELRALYPDVKAVVSSGYSGDSVMADYKKYGFCGVVPKPYTHAALTSAVKKALTRQ